MAEFSSFKEYLQTCDSLDAKIAAIDAIIDALLLSAADAAESSNFSEYWIDNGQTKVRTTYRSIDDVAKGVIAWQRVRQIYMSQKRGRVVRLMDSSNFPGRK